MLTSAHPIGNYWSVWFKKKKQNVDFFLQILLELGIVKEQIPSSLPQSLPPFSLYPSLASSLLPSKDIPDTQMPWRFLVISPRDKLIPPQALTSYLLSAENWSPAISMDASVPLRSSLLQTFSLCHLPLPSLLSDKLACYTVPYFYGFLKVKCNHIISPFHFSSPTHFTYSLEFITSLPFIVYFADM